MAAKASYLALLLILAVPSLSSPQGLVRQALTAFPADTQQMAYLNLAQLRELPNYRQLRQALFSIQMQNFEQFLRPLGINPEADVDEIVFGRRDPGGDGGTGSFGLAEGRFDSDKAQDYIEREHLPSRSYEGFNLDAFGSGLARDDIFFTFLRPDLAAFGQMKDLEALIDGFEGNRATLSANAEFVNWEAEVEGSGPQWGVTTGKAAASLAVPWVLGRSGQKANLSGILSPIRAVLYQADWDPDFSAQISVICQNRQSAQTLAQLLAICRDSACIAGSGPEGIKSFIHELDIRADGKRVEISGSGPPEVFARVFESVSGR